MRWEITPIQPFFVNNTTRYYKKLVPRSPYVHFYSFTVDAAGTVFSAAVPDGSAGRSVSASVSAPAICRSVLAFHCRNW